MAARPAPRTVGAQLRCAIGGLIAVTLAGCATAPREIVRRVEVPVAAPCPAPTLPLRPHLPLADLPADASAADIARAAAASLEALTGYVRAVDAAVAP